MLLEPPQKGIQDVDGGLGPSFCSACDTGIEYTEPLDESPMIRSRDIASEVRFRPVSVFVGSVILSANAVPHCKRSPFSSMAAPKFLSSLISRNSFPSKKLN